MDKQSIARINALSAIARTRALTKEEVEERARLRAAYLADMRSQFRQKLENTDVTYPDGTVIPLSEAARKKANKK